MSLQAFNKLVLFYHLHCRETTCTPSHELQSHQLSLLALESSTCGIQYLAGGELSDI